MRKLGTWLLAGCMTMAIAATPALAQQGGPGGGMGKGPGQGQGMMGQGAPGQGKGMMGQRGPGQGKGMMQDNMMGGGMMGKANCPRMAGMMGKGMMHSRPMMEARLAYAKADLEITDDQMDAWNAYADAVRKRHDIMEGVQTDMMKAMKSGNVVDRLDARIKLTETGLESLKALKPATEGLYNALTDAQKKKADELLSGTCGMM
jgi:hypothetical protein